MIPTDITKVTDKSLNVSILRKLCTDLKQFKYTSLKNSNGDQIVIKSLKKSQLVDMIKNIIMESNKSINQLIAEYNARYEINENNIIMPTLSNLTVITLRTLIIKIFKITNSHDYPKAELITLFHDLIVKKYGDNISQDDLNNLLELKPQDIIQPITFLNIYDFKSNKIEYIIHIADLHINDSRAKEYQQVFDNFTNDLISKLDMLKERTIIVICGDIFHKKVHQKAESINLWNQFLKNVCDLFPVVAITGNHDYDMKTSDIDWVSSSYKHDNFYHLNTLGQFEFNNIIFGVSPLRPNDQTQIYNMKKEDPNKIYIQLYHGTINGSTVFTNHQLESNCKISDFGEYDLLLLGDIHKMQYLDKEERTAYPGSLIQQNKGESVFKHGYLLWDLNTLSSEFYEVRNDYCYLKVTINEDGFTYDTQIISNKKYINVTYVLMVEDCGNIINLFQAEMEVSGIFIMSSEFEKRYNNQLKQDEYKTITYDKSSTDYLTEYLQLQKYDEYTTNKICDIHKSIKVNDDTNISVSQWNIEYLEFQNIFCYGNNKVNTINFNVDGFYKLFANNFAGKTSIINIIKWVFFGSDSGINDRDILYNHDKDENTLNGYIKCKFNLSNSNLTYVLTKKISCSSKVSGVNVIPTLLINDEEIVGEKNIKAQLNKLIGSYQEFELISSINNNDLGILVDNPFKIFKTLFKLDRFDPYTNECKFLLKQTKLSITDKTNQINKLGDINQNAVDDIKNELTINKNKQNDILLHDLTQLESNRNELIQLDSSIVIKDETPYCDNEHMIKCKEVELSTTFTLQELTKKLKKLRVGNYSNEIFSKIQIQNMQVDMTQHELDVKSLIGTNDTLKVDLHKHKMNLLESENSMHELYEKKNSLSLLINNVEVLNNDKLQAMIIDLTTKCSKSQLNNIQFQLQKLSDDRLNVIKQIDNSIIYNEDEIRNQINKQQFNYAELKTQMINKLETGVVNKQDCKNILLLIKGINYQAILDIIENNKLMTAQLAKINGQIIRLTKRMETENELLETNKDELNKVKGLLITNNNNIAIKQNNTKYNNEIRQLTEEIDNLKKSISIIKLKIADIESLVNNNNKIINDHKLQISKLNDYISNNDNNIKIKEYESDVAILKELQVLQNTQQLYLLYLANIEYNKQNKLIKETYKRDIEAIDDVIKTKREENNVSQINLAKLQEQEKYLSETLTVKIKDLSQFNILKSELDQLVVQLDHLKIYNDILSNNKIPAMILDNNIKSITNYINDILKQYTNFTIDIELSDFESTRKKITIYQNKGDNNKLTINSCSGYETIILNIACKLAIKKYTYINSSSIIMIDEILSKVSVQNYCKLPSLFKIIKDNFKHILIISHIEEIQDMIDDDKKINIVKNNDYSYIKPHLSH